MAPKAASGVLHTPPPEDPAFEIPMNRYMFRQEASVRGHSKRQACTAWNKLADDADTTQVMHNGERWLYVSFNMLNEHLPPWYE